MESVVRVLRGLKGKRTKRDKKRTERTVPSKKEGINDIKRLKLNYEVKIK